MYYMGIDGGGTKTRYMIANEHLTILSDHEGETIHIHQIGADCLERRLLEQIQHACKQASIEMKELSFVFLGVPGYGESQEDMLVIDDIADRVLEGISYKVDNDGVVGWVAGCGCRPGINIVAGTGSIANGRNEAGLSLRCGGWGPNIDDDGSAYWLGLRVINEYTKQKDGRHEVTPLVDILESAYNITYLYEIVDIIFNRFQLSRTELAKFSSLGAEAAKKGCPYCIALFKQAAIELASHIKTLAHQLNLTEHFLVSYTGGVFKAGDLILTSLVEELKDFNCSVQAPCLEPCKGAVLLAYHLDHHLITDELIKKLQ